MNKRRIIRLSVLQTGKLLAVLYGFFSLVMLPFMIIGLCAGANPIDIIPMFVMLILYPIMGFIGGIIMAALYNLSSKFVGGLEVEVETVDTVGVVEIEQPNFPDTDLPKDGRQSWRS